MWCYKKMLKLIGVDNITNEKVLNRIREREHYEREFAKKNAGMICHTLDEGIVETYSGR